MNIALPSTFNYFMAGLSLGLLCCLLFPSRSGCPLAPHTLRQNGIITARFQDLPWGSTSHVGTQIQRKLYFDEAQLLQGPFNKDKALGMKSWALAEFGPKSGTRRHTHHGALEVFFVKEGRCRVSADGQADVVLVEGDSFAVLPVTYHDVWNDSETARLVLVYTMVQYSE